MMLFQATQAPPDLTPQNVAQWSLLVVMLVALWRAVYIMRDIYREFTANSAAERKECNDRHDKKDQLVAAQCTMLVESGRSLVETSDKMSQTILSINNSKLESEKAMREFSERREERLHDLVREVRKEP